MQRLCSPHPLASLPLRQEKSAMTGPGRPGPGGPRGTHTAPLPTYGCCRPGALLGQCWLKLVGAQGLKPLIPPTWLGCSLSDPEAPAPVRMPPTMGSSLPRQPLHHSSLRHTESPHPTPEWLGAWCVGVEHTGRAASGRTQDAAHLKWARDSLLAQEADAEAFSGPWYQKPPRWAPFLPGGQLWQPLTGSPGTPSLRVTAVE